MGMIRFLYLLVGLVISTGTFAAKIVSDPLDPATAFCGAKLNNGARVNTPVAIAGTVKTCSIDVLSTAVVGTNTIDATAVPAVGDTAHTESMPASCRMHRCLSSRLSSRLSSPWSNLEARAECDLRPSRRT